MKRPSQVCLRRGRDPLGWTWTAPSRRTADRAGRVAALATRSSASAPGRPREGRRSPKQDGTDRTTCTFALSRWPHHDMLHPLQLTRLPSAFLIADGLRPRYGYETYRLYRLRERNHLRRRSFSGSFSGRLFTRFGGPRVMTPRAMSSTVAATLNVCDSSNAIRMSICTAPAWAADPVLIRTPTKAPGSVARPAVRVESRLGSSALAAESPMISLRESRSLIPRLSAASTSPARTLRTSSARRAATAVAVMVLPSTMATIGTTATPVAGTTPDSSSRGSTATKPSPRHAASQGDPRLAWLRRAAVRLATRNMTPSTRADDHRRIIAAAKTPATAANCTAARNAAHGTVHGEPSAVSR